MSASGSESVHGVAADNSGVGATVNMNGLDLNALGSR